MSAEMTHRITDPVNLSTTEAIIGKNCHANTRIIKSNEVPPIHTVFPGCVGVGVRVRGEGELVREDRRTAAAAPPPRVYSLLLL